MKTEPGNCKTCNHEPHAASFCAQCNCGENDVVRPTRVHPRPPEGYSDYIARIYNGARVVRFEKGHYGVCG